METNDVHLVINHIIADGNRLLAIAKRDDCSNVLPTKELNEIKRIKSSGPVDMVDFSDLSIGKIVLILLEEERTRETFFYRFQIVDTRKLEKEKLVSGLSIEDGRWIDEVPISYLHKSNYIIDKLRRGHELFVLADVTCLENEWAPHCINSIIEVLVNKNICGIIVKDQVQDLGFLRPVQLNGSLMLSRIIANNLVRFTPSFPLNRPSVPRNSYPGFSSSQPQMEPPMNDMGLYRPQMSMVNPNIGPLPPPPMPPMMPVMRSPSPTPSHLIAPPPNIPFPTLKFFSLPIKKDVVEDCRVILIEEGPLAFCIRQESLEAELLPMQVRIEKYIRDGMSLPLSNFQEGTAVLCKNSMDGSFKRGLITGNKNGYLDVFLIDHGTMEHAGQTSIFSVHPDLFATPMLMTRCRLYNLPENVNSQIKLNFANIIDNRKLRATFVKVDKIKRHEITLELNGLSMLKLITQKAFGREGLTLDKNVVVSYICPASRYVFLQLFDNQDELFTMQSEVQLFGKTASIAQNLFRGKPCIALFNDGSESLWYRAIILGRDDKSVKVFFVDYGNEMSIPHEDVKEIAINYVMYMPAQAIRCTLSGMENLTYNSEKMLEIFESYESLTAAIEFFNEESIYNIKEMVPQVELCDNSTGLVLTEKLVAVLRGVDIDASTDISSRAEGPSIVPDLLKKCIVSHINSSSDFYVTLVEHSEAIKTIRLNLSQTIRSQGEPTSFAVGEFVSVPWGASGAGGLVYERARIIHTLKRTVKVVLIDIGAEKSGKKEEVRQLPEEVGLHWYECLAVKCTLGSGGALEEDVDKFKGTLQGKEVKVHFKESLDGVWLVSLLREWNPIRESPKAVPTSISPKTTNEKSSFYSHPNVDNKISNDDFTSPPRIRNFKQSVDEPDFSRKSKFQMENHDFRDDSSQHSGEFSRNRNFSSGSRDGAAKSGGFSRNRDFSDSTRDGSSRGGGFSRRDDFSNSTRNNSSNFGGFSDSTNSGVSFPEQPCMNDGDAVYISFICLSSRTVWLHRELDETSLEKINNAARNEYRTARRTSYINVDQLCIAQSCEDNSWYRCIVKNTPRAGKVNIHYVDFGNFEDLPKERLRQITNSLTTTHPLAYGCTFNRDVAKFEDLVKFQDKKMTVGVHSKLEDKYVLSLFLDGENILDIGSEGNKKSTIEPMTSRQDTSQVNSVSAEIKEVVEAEIDDLVPRTIPELDTKLEVIVSFIDEYGNLFVQLSKNSEQLDVLMEDLAESVESEMLLSTVKSGLYCAAKYSLDMGWYRAKISNVKGNQISVCYIDYGNNEVVDIGDVKTLPFSCIELPSQAIKCSILELESFSGKNKIGKLEWMTELALECKFQARNGGYLMKNATMEGASLAEKIRKDICDQGVDQDSSPGIRFSLSHFTKQSEFSIVNTEDDGTIHLQCCNHQDQLDSMMALIDSHMKDSTLEVLEDPSAGMYCITQYAEDSVWYRAKITEVTNDNVTVCFIDYGNLDAVTKDLVYKIDEQFMDTPIQAISCTLEQFINRELTDSDFNLLDIMVEKGVLKGKIKAEGGLNIIINCTLDGIPLSNVLGSNNQEIESPVEGVTPEKLTLPSDMFDGLVEFAIVHTEDDGTIHLQMTSHQEKLNALMASIATHIAEDKGKVIEEPSVGMNCITQFVDDSVWYRARITDIEGQVVKVHFMDYGNVDSQDKDLIYKICESFSALPAQAIACMLDLFNGVDLGDNHFKLMDAIVENGYLKGELIEDDGILILKNGTLSDTPLNTVLRSYGESEDADVVKEVSNVEDANPESMDGVDVRHVSNDAEAISSEVIENLPFSSDVFDGEHEFDVVHTEDDGMIHLQMKSHQDELNALMASIDSLITYKEGKKLEELSIGMNCITQFADDLVWYRAKIISIEGQVIGVKFIDYGNVDSQNKDLIYELGHELSALPAQAIGCFPDVMKGVELADEHFKLLDDIVANGSICGEIVEENGILTLKNGKSNGTHLDDMLKSYRNEVTQNVTEETVAFEVDSNIENVSSIEITSDMPEQIINQKSLDEIQFDLNLFKGRQEFSIVHSCNENALFYLQSCNQQETLDAMMESIATWADESKNLNVLIDPVIGMYCLAQFSEDSVWYRARITNINEQEITICFIDYGNIDTMNCDSIYVLPEIFWVNPIQAIECTLEIFKNKELTEEDTKLMDLIVERGVINGEIYEEGGVFILKNGLADGIPPLVPSEVVPIEDRMTKENETTEIESSKFDDVTSNNFIKNETESDIFHNNESVLNNSQSSQQPLDSSNDSANASWVDIIEKIERREAKAESENSSVENVTLEKVAVIKSREMLNKSSDLENEVANVAVEEMENIESREMLKKSSDLEEEIANLTVEGVANIESGEMLNKSSYFEEEIPNLTIQEVANIECREMLNKSSDLEEEIANLTVEEVSKIESREKLNASIDLEEEKTNKTMEEVANFESREMLNKSSDFEDEIANVSMEEVATIEGRDMLNKSSDQEDDFKDAQSSIGSCAMIADGDSMDFLDARSNPDIEEPKFDSSEDISNLTHAENGQQSDITFVHLSSDQSNEIKVDDDDIREELDKGLQDVTIKQYDFEGFESFQEDIGSEAEEATKSEQRVISHEVNSFKDLNGEKPSIQAVAEIVEDSIEKAQSKEYHESNVYQSCIKSKTFENLEEEKSTALRTDMDLLDLKESESVNEVKIDETENATISEDFNESEKDNYSEEENVIEQISQKGSEEFDICESFEHPVVGEKEEQDNKNDISQDYNESEVSNDASLEYGIIKEQDGETKQKSVELVQQELIDEEEFVDIKDAKGVKELIQEELEENNEVAALEDNYKNKVEASIDDGEHNIEFSESINVHVANGDQMKLEDESNDFCGFEKQEVQVVEENPNKQQSNNSIDESADLDWGEECNKLEESNVETAQESASLASDQTIPRSEKSEVNLENFIKDMDINQDQEQGECYQKYDNDIDFSDLANEQNDDENNCRGLGNYDVKNENFDIESDKNEAFDSKLHHTDEEKQSFDIESDIVIKYDIDDVNSVDKDWDDKIESTRDEAIPATNDVLEINSNRMHTNDICCGGNDENETDKLQDNENNDAVSSTIKETVVHSTINVNSDVSVEVIKKDALNDNQINVKEEDSMNFCGLEKHEAQDDRKSGNNEEKNLNKQQNNNSIDESMDPDWGEECDKLEEPDTEGAFESASLASVQTIPRSEKSEVELDNLITTMDFDDVNFENVNQEGGYEEEEEGFEESDNYIDLAKHTKESNDYENNSKEEESTDVNDENYDSIKCSVVIDLEKSRLLDSSLQHSEDEKQCLDIDSTFVKKESIDNDHDIIFDTIEKNENMGLENTLADEKVESAKDKDLYVTHAEKDNDNISPNQIETNEICYESNKAESFGESGKYIDKTSNLISEQFKKLDIVQQESKESIKKLFRDVVEQDPLIDDDMSDSFGNEIPELCNETFNSVDDDNVDSFQETTLSFEHETHEGIDATSINALAEESLNVIKSTVQKLEHMNIKKMDSVDSGDLVNGNSVENSCSQSKQELDFDENSGDSIESELMPPPEAPVKPNSEVKNENNIMENFDIEKALAKKFPAAYARRQSISEGSIQDAMIKNYSVDELRDLSIVKNNIFKSTVVHCDDDSTFLWVQKENDLETVISLEKKLDSLNQSCLEENQKPQVESICLCPHLNSLQRAKITKINQESSTATIFLIDIGGIRLTDLKTIYVCPPSLMNIKPLAMPIKLPLTISDENVPAINSFLVESVIKEQVTCLSLAPFTTGERSSSYTAVVLNRLNCELSCRLSEENLGKSIGCDLVGEEVWEMLVKILER